MNKMMLKTCPQCGMPLKVEGGFNKIRLYCPSCQKYERIEMYLTSSGKKKSELMREKKPK
jgi:uncharacterized Zn finger protein (UPF0148 family)